MTGALALGVAVMALVMIVVVLVSLRSLRRSIATLHDDVDRLTRGLATADDLRVAVTAAVTQANAPTPDPDLAPVSRVPTALRTGPVIKAMAIGSGTAHVARRLRGIGGGAANGHGRTP